MSAQEAAVRLAARTLLGKLNDAGIKADKVELAGLIGAGDRVTARLTSGTKVGSVTYTEGSTSATVSDEAALLAWVQAHHPEEVVPKVNDAYRSKLLADAKAHGHAVDVTDGEIPPGITVRQGKPHLTVTPTTDPAALAEFVQAIRANGELALDGAVAGLGATP